MRTVSKMGFEMQENQKETVDLEVHEEVVRELKWQNFKLRQLIDYHEQKICILENEVEYVKMKEKSDSFNKNKNWMENND